MFKKRIKTIFGPKARLPLVPISSLGTGTMAFQEPHLERSQSEKQLIERPQIFTQYKRLRLYLWLSSPLGQIVLFCFFFVVWHLCSMQITYADAGLNEADGRPQVNEPMTEKERLKTAPDLAVVKSQLLIIRKQLVHMITQNPPAFPGELTSDEAIEYCMKIAKYLTARFPIDSEDPAFWIPLLEDLDNNKSTVWAQLRENLYKDADILQKIVYLCSNSEIDGVNLQIAHHFGPVYSQVMSHFLWSYVELSLKAVMIHSVN